MSGREPLDLNQLARDPQYVVELRTLETIEERNARIQRQSDLARHRRQVFWAVFAVVIVAAVSALFIILFSENQDNRDWARTLFSAIIAGLVGYVVGGGVTNTNDT